MPLFEGDRALPPSLPPHPARRAPASTPAAPATPPLPSQLRLNVIEAENGHEGLQAYLRHGRDIAFVLLDLVMPVSCPSVEPPPSPWAAHAAAGAACAARVGSPIACCLTGCRRRPAPAPQVLDGFNAALGIRSAESRRGWLPVPIVVRS